jgi:hypothetical protein
MHIGCMPVSWERELPGTYLECFCGESGVLVFCRVESRLDLAASTRATADLPIRGVGHPLCKVIHNKTRHRYSREGLIHTNTRDLGY